MFVIAVFTAKIVQLKQNTLKMVMSKLNKPTGYMTNCLRFLPTVGMTLQLIKERGRGRHGGSKHSQNGNNIRRRVCPFSPTLQTPACHVERSETSLAS